MTQQRLVIQWTRFFPYHVARLRAAREFLEQSEIEVVGLQTASQDLHYADVRTALSGSEWIHTAFADRVADTLGADEMLQGIGTALDTLSPAAVAISGYGTLDSLACLEWCLRNGAPAIVMSESWEADFRRVRWRETLKSLIVRLYDAALVGGGRHRRYIAGLGMPADRIATGYDVVDNAFFLDGRSGTGNERESDLVSSGPENPRRYLLASGRFVERKNFMRLMQAYRLFRQRDSCAGWDLVLAGSGPLLPALQAMAEEPDLAGHVHLPGFVQYHELPKLYRQADAFICPSESDQWALVVNEAMAAGLPVLVSTQCGCAEELVQPGENGFLFDPFSVEAITEAMQKLAKADLEKMGASSLERIREFAPDAFAEGIGEAWKWSKGARRPAWKAIAGGMLVRSCLKLPVRREKFT